MSPASLGNLVLQILAGIVFSRFAMVSPSAAQDAGLLGSLFVGALKAVAPILVFILVAASIANQRKVSIIKVRPIVFTWLGTFRPPYSRIKLHVSNHFDTGCWRGRCYSSSRYWWSSSHASYLLVDNPVSAPRTQPSVFLLGHRSWSACTTHLQQPKRFSKI